MVKIKDVLGNDSKLMNCKMSRMGVRLNEPVLKDGCKTITEIMSCKISQMGSGFKEVTKTINQILGDEQMNDKLDVIFVADVLNECSNSNESQAPIQSTNSPDVDELPIHTDPLIAQMNPHESFVYSLGLELVSINYDLSYENRSITNTGLAPFKLQTLKCQFCDFTTESQLVLDTHLTEPHSTSLKNMKCNFCDSFRTTSKLDYKNHMSTVHCRLCKLENKITSLVMCSICDYENHSKSKQLREEKINNHILNECNFRESNLNQIKAMGSNQPIDYRYILNNLQSPSPFDLLLHQFIFDSSPLDKFVQSFDAFTDKFNRNASVSSFDLFFSKITESLIIEHNNSAKISYLDLHRAIEAKPTVTKTKNQKYNCFDEDSNGKNRKKTSRKKSKLEEKSINDVEKQQVLYQSYAENSNNELVEPFREENNNLITNTGENIVDNEDKCRLDEVSLEKASVDISTSNDEQTNEKEIDKAVENIITDNDAMIIEMKPSCEKSILKEKENANNLFVESIEQTNSSTEYLECKDCSIKFTGELKHKCYLKHIEMLHLKEPKIKLKRLGHKSKLQKKKV